MRIVTNHWGWTLRGVRTWLRYGWAWPVDVWGVEVWASSPRQYRRRVKIGPVCFGLGRFAERTKPPPA